jgi:hypothetical protein
VPEKREIAVPDAVLAPLVGFDRRPSTSRWI